MTAAQRTALCALLERITAAAAGSSKIDPTAGLKAAQPLLDDIERRVDELAVRVEILAAVERHRMYAAQLAAWEHAGIKPNGHHREEHS